MKKHSFLAMNLNATGVHFAKFDGLVQGSIETISIRATENSATGTMTEVYLIHNPDKHKPRYEIPPDDLLCVQLSDIEITPSATVASIKTEIDEKPAFSGGLGIVIDAELDGAVELSIVVGVDI